MTKKQLINEGKLEQALTILKSVADSNSVPRNIRKIVKESNQLRKNVFSDIIKPEDFLLRLKNSSNQNLVSII